MNAPALVAEIPEDIAQIAKGMVEAQYARDLIDPEWEEYIDIAHAILAERERCQRGMSENGWQPLETAPRDGTQVIFHVAAGHGIMGPSPARYAIVQWEDNGPHSCWVFGQSSAWNPDAMPAGTVWQPLPAPPTTGAA